jgi:hypothetical protein
MIRVRLVELALEPVVFRVQRHRCCFAVNLALRPPRRTSVTQRSDLVLAPPDRAMRAAQPAWTRRFAIARTSGSGAVLSMTGAEALAVETIIKS